MFKPVYTYWPSSAPVCFVICMLSYAQRFVVMIYGLYVYIYIYNFFKICQYGASAQT